MSDFVDNKTLQQSQNNNKNQGQAATAGPTTNDNKSASRVALSSIYSPSPIPSTTQSIAYAVAKLKAATLSGATTTKRNLALSISVDVSGSMNGDRIETAKESLKFVIDQLRPGDSLGLVTFSDNATVALNMTKMDAAGKARATAVVNGFRASGSTNLSGGLFLAHSLACPGSKQPIVAPLQPPPFYGANPYVAPGFPFVPGPVPLTVPVPGILPPTMFQPPVAAHAPTIAVQMSHEYNGNGNNPNEKCQYKLKIVAPEDKIAKFTIHDPENRFADILGSGETELDLKPLPAPIQKLEISFEVIGVATEQKVTYFLGETPSGKKNVNIPATAVPVANNNNNNTNANGKIDDNTLRVVMLFTDGHANLGIKDTPALVAQTQAVLAASRYDSTIFTFGFGANHNADMLQQVASASEGMFYFIESTKVLPEIFADCLGGLLSTVAQNVKVTARLTPGQGIRFGTPMTKFKTEVADNGNTLIITMKDLYAEEDRDILLELKVDGPTAKAACVDTAGGVGIEFTLEFSDAAATDNTSKVVLKNTCIFTISSDSAPVINNEVDLQVQRFTSIQVMNKVREAADQGRLEEARRMAHSYNTVLQSAPSSSMAANQMIQQQMQNLEQLALDTTTWGAKGSKQSAAYAQSHAFQRGNAVSEDCAYAGNAMKMEMRSKAKAKTNESK